MDNRGLRASLSAAQEGLNRLEHHRVLAIGTEARAQLSCATEIVDPSLLAKIYVMEGTALLREKDREGAWGSFAKAAALDPDLPWDSSLEATAATLYAEAREGRCAEAEGTLLLRAPRDGRVYVDGIWVLAAEAMSLVPGVHIVQLDGHSGMETQLVVLEPGGLTSLELGTPQRYVPSIELGRRRALLVGGAGAAVVSLGCSVIAFSAASAAAESWREGEGGQDMVRQSRVGAVLGWIGLGFGVTSSGMTLGLAAFTRPVASTGAIWVAP